MDEVCEWAEEWGKNGLLGFDFWNGWWRLKMKKNGQDQFSHMGIESWAQGWAKIKME